MWPTGQKGCRPLVYCRSSQLSTSGHFENRRGWIGLRVLTTRPLLIPNAGEKSKNGSPFNFACFAPKPVTSFHLLRLFSDFLGAGIVFFYNGIFWNILLAAFAQKFFLQYFYRYYFLQSNYFNEWIAFIVREHPLQSNPDKKVYAESEQSTNSCKTAKS